MDGAEAKSSDEILNSLFALDEFDNAPCPCGAARGVLPLEAEVLEF